MKIYFNEDKSKICVVSDNGSVDIFTQGTDTQGDVFVGSNVKTPTFAKKKSGSGKVGRPKKATGDVNVLPEPNLKLIQEYGRTTITAIADAKRSGMTAEEIDQDMLPGTGHLTFGQVETIYDQVKI